MAIVRNSKRLVFRYVEVTNKEKKKFINRWFNRNIACLRVDVYCSYKIYKLEKYRDD